MYDKQVGLLKYTAGGLYGLGRNDTPRYAVPSRSGSNVGKSDLTSEQGLLGVAAQSPLDQPKVQKLHRDKCDTGSDQHGEYK